MRACRGFTTSLRPVFRQPACVGAAAFFLVVLAGCDSNGSEEAASQRQPVPDEVASAEEEHTAPSSPDGGEPSTLQPPNEPEPDIDLTGPVEEIERIYREQDAYDSWLFANPDPANPERLARIVHRDCPCWKSDHKLLSHYAKNNQWWTGPGNNQLIRIEVVDQPSPNLIKLYVTWKRDGPGELIDETGRIYDRLPPARGKNKVTMRRGIFDPNNPHRDRSGDAWKIIIDESLIYEILSEGSG